MMDALVKNSDFKNILFTAALALASPGATLGGIDQLRMGQVFLQQIKSQVTSHREEGFGYAILGLVRLSFDGFGYLRMELGYQHEGEGLGYVSLGWVRIGKVRFGPDIT